MTLSVIIPIYNAKASLMRCVDSVVLQELSPDGMSGMSGKPDTNVLEVILVDDGSTDGSGEMCDNIKRQYEDENCKITVIHREKTASESVATHNYSAAISEGIKASTQELITFISASDFLGRNTYPKQMEFFQCADDVDVVEFPVAKYYNDFLKKENFEFAVDFYKSITDYLLDTKAQRHPYLFNKIFRRSVIVQAMKECDTTVIPDELLCALLLKQARRIVTNDGGYYFYTFVKDRKSYGEESEKTFFEAAIKGEKMSFKQRASLFFSKIKGRN